jgi:serine/threonine protein kinase
LYQLKHQNIVQFIESFKEGFNYCIITEYCAGGDLRKKIEDTRRRNLTIKIELILIWSHEIINALDFLHSNEIIHRDIKPEYLNSFLIFEYIKILN